MKYCSKLQNFRLDEHDFVFFRFMSVWFFNSCLLVNHKL